MFANSRLTELIERVAGLLQFAEIGFARVAAVVDGRPRPRHHRGRAEVVASARASHLMRVYCIVHDK